MFKKGDKPPKPLLKGNRLAVKHSLHVYRRMLDGTKADGRTTLFKVLKEKERELTTALGGDPSPQERLIIADTVKTILYVGTLDEYLMALDGGIARGGKVIPVIESRTQLAAHLRRNLEALGLSRRIKTTSITDLLADHHETAPEPTPARISNGTTNTRNENRARTMPRNRVNDSTEPFWRVC